MEYFSAIKSNELLYATPWVDLKDIILNWKKINKKLILKGYMLCDYMYLPKEQNYSNRIGSVLGKG